jgi:hypothetical protein
MNPARRHAFALTPLALACGLFLCNPARAVVPTPVTVTNVPLPVTGTVNGTVSVVDTKTAPLFVDTGQQARSAFTGSCQAGFDANGNASCTVATVPSGTILVTETVTCGASIAPPGAGSTINQLTMLIGFNGPLLGGGATSQYHRLLMPLAASWSGSPTLNYYGVGSVPLKIVLASAGTPLWFMVQSGMAQPSSASIGCTVSGYTVAQ